MGPRRSRDSPVRPLVREQESSEGVSGERSRQPPPAPRQPRATLQFWDRQARQGCRAAGKKANLCGLRRAGEASTTFQTWSGSNSDCERRHDSSLRQ